MSALILLSHLLTHSRLKSARFCRRQHRFKYVDGYRPIDDSDELDFGSLMHLALEQWWLAVQLGLPQEAWLLNAMKAIDESTLDAFQKAKAEVLMLGYHETWRHDADGFEVLGVEERFEYPLRNPETGGTSTVWRIGGKLDVRVRRKSDGAYGFIEHKTSGEDVSAGSDYWKRLRLDAQVSIYFDGSDSLGHRPTFCLYDVIGKPAQRPLKATPPEKRKFTAAGKLYANQREADETPDEYKARLCEALAENQSKFFQRGEVVRLESELDEARFDIWQQAAQLREEIRAERFPKNPDNCARCDFFPVCSGEASLDDPTRYRRGNPHPELMSEEESSERQRMEAAHDSSTTAETA